MAWIEFHEELRDHWKVHRLQRKLGLNSYAEALGKLTLFWLWLIPNARNGNVQKFDNSELCRAFNLQNDFEDVKKILIECELLDENFLVHDWKKHGVSYLDKTRKRVSKYRVQKRYSNVTDTVQKRSTIPNLTIPNLTIKEEREQFIFTLKEKYKNIDVDEELEKALEWISERPKRKFSKRFFLNWLKNAELYKKKEVVDEPKPFPIERHYGDRKDEKTAGVG